MALQGQLQGQLQDLPGQEQPALGLPWQEEAVPGQQPWLEEEM